jgi:hypothetical protein
MITYHYQLSTAGWPERVIRPTGGHIETAPRIAGRRAVCRSTGGFFWILFMGKESTGFTGLIQDLQIISVKK